MKSENNLYELLYQSILTQLYSGVLQRGQQFPVQQELCRQYNVGITTVRKVIRMLEKDGFIITTSGKRAIVCYDKCDQNHIYELLQRKDSILDIYGGLELLMPSLYVQGALRCDTSAMRAILDNMNDNTETAEFYEQTVFFFTQLLLPYQNQIILDLQSDLEHYARVPYLPRAELYNPFAITIDEGKAGLQFSLSD